MLSVAVSPDGKWLVSGSKDRGVQFWDPNTGQVQFMLQGHKNSGRLPPSHCCQVLSGYFLAPIANSSFFVFDYIVISVALSPAGTYFATGSGDTRARVWSYESLEL